MPSKFNPADHLMKLKGKDYLPVAWRLVWFREQYPSGIIDTEPIQISDTHAVFRATVTAIDDEGNVKGRATGHKAQSKQGFADFVEKAETGSIGRALAALGFGTQFDPELDEGERLADSPVERPTTPPRATQAPAKASSGGAGEPAMKRMHAILSEKGLGHEHLHEYAKSLGHDSSKEMTVDEMKKLADGLKDKPEAAIKYLVKLVQDAELLQINSEVGQMADAQKGK